MGLMTGLDGTLAAASVVALHCSLGSGRQWTKLAAGLGGDRFMAPDISGYGVAACGRDWPRTLDGEIARLEPWLAKADGPIHLIGHSYGGGISAGDRLALCAARSQPDADRAGASDVASRYARRCAAVRPLRADRAGRLKGYCRRRRAGGGRGVHRVLGRLRAARTVLAERAAADDRAGRQAALRFQRRARSCRGGGSRACLEGADAADVGRAVALCDAAHCRKTRRADR
ncbi:alpha/beta fold hydrolase [Bradyrhizobium elkanii]|uniref:alpha/beta fold hydrolase n=1 Tax=Bradyrhizobium elkanii TaxID=29448 RepID=UPI0015C3CA0B|nr:alpha/beta hydrolase [Bradyrhizobium elkanii]